jgi:TonB-linked outer membrane protein, SusC/RagA family
MEKNSIYLRSRLFVEAYNNPSPIFRIIKLCLLTSFLFLFQNFTFSQQIKVSGTITDATSGEPLVGVSIAVEGSSQGTVTDVKGKFIFDAISPNATLICSYLGYATEKVNIAGQSTVDLKMVPDLTKLEEVVVVGYGVQKKKLVTGATVEVKGEDIIKKSTVSPMVALQSTSPGVNITKISGQPGDGFKVNIRGVGTVGNSQPLYIVDGVPRGDINYLNPSDIQSIDILKDAASAAIYGSRAANGVVLVTTKQGKKLNKVSLTYDGYYGVQNVYKRLPLLDAKQYMMIQDEASVNSGGKPYDWKNELAPGDYQRIQNGTWNGTNWLKEIENKNAPIQSHAFNITGGNDVSVFSAGVSYTSQDGIYGKPVEAKYDRYTFRINSEHAVFRNGSLDILKIGENVSYSYVQNNGIATGNMWGNNIYSAIEQDPLLPMYATDKSDPAYPYHSPIPWNSLASNPVASMVYNNGYNLNKSHSLSANVFAVLQPIKGLKYRASFSVTPNFNSYRSFNPVYYLGPNNHNDNNGVTQNMNGGYGYIFENTLNYEFSLNKAHNFNIMVGSSAEKGNLGEQLSVSNKNSIFNDFGHAYITNANVNSTATIGGGPQGLDGEWGILSYFGRINYDYMEKYMLTLIARRDGSSNFRAGNRWATFPSISAGWVVSNESFMEPTKSVLDFLKLRGSWGQNGNQQIPGFQYVSLVTFNNPASNIFSNYYFGAAKINPSIGAFPFNLPTPNLKWETSEQLDLGLDARLLNSRFSLAFDYYKKTTKDWLVAAPVLASYGVNIPPYINGGEIQNTGYEIALGWKDKIGKDFTYGISANMSFNHNEVTQIDNLQGIIHGNNVKLWGNGTYVAQAKVGEPLGYFYGFKTAGIFQSAQDVQNYKDKNGKVIMPNAVPGDVRFVDTDGDGAITDNDRVNIGDPNPHVMYSINLNCEYKGFDFSVNTYGVGGNKIARCFHDAGAFANNYTTEVLGRWHGPGTSNRIPRVTSGGSINTEYNSDLEIEDGSYLRISNVTLGYDIKKIAKSLPVAQLRLFVTVQNLYTFTKYSGMDPEIGTSTDEGSNPFTTTPWARSVDLGFYPNPRTFMFGASIKF